MCFSVSCPISWLSYLYQPSSFGLGLIQIHRAMISGMIQKNTCNKVYIYTTHNKLRIFGYGFNSPVIITLDPGQIAKEFILAGMCLDTCVN